MSDEYLWDRTGEADADVAHLEKVLDTLRWPSQPVRSSGGPLRKIARMRRTVWIAMAAVLAITISTVIWERTRPVHETGWRLYVSGQPPSVIKAGQLIRTARGMSSLMKSDSVGQVQVEPDSRIRVLAKKGVDQLALDVGTIHALIWAPPARFIVSTPAANAVDLGCEYTLHVARTGEGLLTVETGWVAFEWRGIESFIPAGAMCTTRPGHGPDTPYFADAPDQLKRAVADFDLSGNGKALRTALDSARNRDGLTLWHLMERTHGLDRARVFERLAQLVQLPPGVTRDGIIAGNRASFDVAWDALGFGNTGWWREWKREW